MKYGLTYKIITSLVAGTMAFSLMTVPAAAALPAAGTSTVQTQADSRSQISPDQALTIALRDAGVKKHKAFVTCNRLIDDDVKPYYLVEFISDKNAYSYEIDASTGVIIHKDIDMD